MPTNAWKTLHGMLSHCNWFSRVGESSQLDADPSIMRVHSWESAVAWTENDVSLWCSNEASNVLSLKLHTMHNKEYQLWNDQIRSFRSSISELLITTINPQIPEAYRVKGVSQWIQMQLTGAYLECVYSDLVDVRLARDHVEWFIRGHFPCGCFVEGESSFPAKAVTVVF